MSTKRKSSLHIATTNVQKKADKDRAKALKKSPTATFKKGDVCLELEPLNDVDRTKVDSGNLVGVIFDMNDDKSVAKVATKHGLLHRSYDITGCNQ